MTTERQVAFVDPHDLAEQIKGKTCLRCHSDPRVAWIKGQYQLRCNCYPTAPALGKPTYVADERMWEMVQQQGIAKRENALTVEEIAKYISPFATQKEAYIFLRFCQAQDLNPFAREAYLIKYDEKAKAAIVIGLAADLKRASLHPQFQGFKNGIVVQDKAGAIQHRDGTLEYPGDVLIGGWAEIHRQGCIPLHHEVSLKEYDRRQSLWKEKPATMIAKVPLSQGLRRLFPESVGALHVTVEGLETLPEESVEVEAVRIAPPAGNAQERPQDDQGGASSGEGGEGQVVEVEEAPAFKGTKLFELWNYGMNYLGYKTKREMLDKLGVKDESQVADVQEAAIKLRTLNG